jgi:glycosyltransferase involved in cell wall biosynthesis
MNKDPKESGAMDVRESSEESRIPRTDSGNADFPIHIFLPNLLEGGAQHVMVRIANHFAKLGHPTTLIVSSAGGPHERKISPDVTLVSLDAGNMLSAMLKLASYMTRKSPPTLLTAITFANLPALIAKRIARSNTKIVISERHACSKWLANRRFSRRMLYGRLIPRIYPWADAMIAVSNGVADDLSKMIGVDRKKIRVVFNPSIDAMDRPGPDVSPSHEWFSQPEVPVIVAAGRLHPQKDFETLIRAFALVRERRPVRLLILGEGSERQPLELLVAKLGLERDVVLHGYIDDPLPYFGAASLFVLSSVYEGFPNVLVEALACGAPVVSTDCESGPREILQDGRLGPLVPVGSPSRLADAIERVLDAPGDQEARLRRAADFTVAQTAQGYLSVLRDVTVHHS